MERLEVEKAYIHFCGILRMCTDLRNEMVSHRADETVTKHYRAAKG